MVIKQRYNSLAAAVPAAAEAAVVLEFHLIDRGQKVGELTKYLRRYNPSHNF